MNKSQSQRKNIRLASARKIVNPSRNNICTSSQKNKQTFEEYNKNSGSEYLMKTLSKNTVYNNNEKNNFQTMAILNNIGQKALFNNEEKEIKKKFSSQKDNNLRYENMIKGQDPNNKRNSNNEKKYSMININQYAENKKEDLKIESGINTEKKDEEKQNHKESKENNESNLTKLMLWGKKTNPDNKRSNVINIKSEIKEEKIEETKNSEVNTYSEFLENIDTNIIVNQSLGFYKNDINKSQNKQPVIMSQSSQGSISTNFEGESQNNINQFLYNNNKVNNNYEFNCYGNYGLSQEFINGIKSNIPFMFGNFKVYGIASYNSNFT